MDEDDIYGVRVPDGMAGRIDKVLADLVPDLSRSRLKALIEEGAVSVNGEIVTTASTKIAALDDLEVIMPPPVEADPKPENIPLDIVYEDDDLLVINKPAGLVVHPGAGNWSGTLVNALLHHCKDSLSGIGGVLRPGIVHRLDKETSGLMLVAKNDKAHKGLSLQLADRTLGRTYEAFCWKAPTIVKGKVDLPIGRHPGNRIRMTVRPAGAKGAREAITQYLCVEKFSHDVASRLACALETGRTHQIRVHMAQMGLPLIGDPLYGLPRQEQAALLKRGGYEAETADFVLDYPYQALHAAEIHFIHPVTDAEMSFDAPRPELLETLYNHLKSTN